MFTTTLNRIKLKLTDDPIPFEWPHWLVSLVAFFLGNQRHHILQALEKGTLVHPLAYSYGLSNHEFLEYIEEAERLLNHAILSKHEKHGREANG